MNEFVDAAMQLFANQGYSATSIKAIARACNMADAGVFHHFNTQSGCPRRPPGAPV